MSNEEKRIVMRANVLNCLTWGRDSAVTLTTIVGKTGYHERAVRELIEELRCSGHLVCNEQNGKGYYIAETFDEIMRQYLQDCRRAMSILRRIKPFRRAVRLMRQKEENQDQLRIEEIFGLMEDKI